MPEGVSGCQRATYESLRSITVAPDVLLLHVTDGNLQTPMLHFNLMH